MSDRRRFKVDCEGAGRFQARYFDETVRVWADLGDPRPTQQEAAAFIAGYRTSLPVGNPAEAYADDIVARIGAADEPLSEADNYDEEVLVGSRYLYAGNGPTVHVTVVRKGFVGRGEVQFGVVEHNDGHGTTCAVIPAADAKRVEDALRGRS